MKNKTNFSTQRRGGAKTQGEVRQNDLRNLTYPSHGAFVVVADDVRSLTSHGDRPPVTNDPPRTRSVAHLPFEASSPQSETRYLVCYNFHVAIFHRGRKELL
jgi:hypothetical protein